MLLSVSRINSKNFCCELIEIYIFGIQGIFKKNLFSTFALTHFRSEGNAHKSLETYTTHKFLFASQYKDKVIKLIEENKKRLKKYKSWRNETVLAYFNRNMDWLSLFTNLGKIRLIIQSQNSLFKSNIMLGSNRKPLQYKWNVLQQKCY